MRSMWKGALSFGLVSIPVKMYGATEEHDVSFKQVRASDGSRVRYKRVAEADGEEVASGEIAKGVEVPGGRLLILTDKDFASLPLTTKNTVDVHEFVPLEEVDPIYFAKSYYLEPDKGGVKSYVLLRQALLDSGMVALTKVAIRSKEQLAVVRVRDDVLVMETMVWPDEVRAADFPFLDEETEVRPQELAMATSLVASMATSFDPTKYTDDYQTALQAVIDAKTGDGATIAIPEGSSPEDADGTVVDLMAALRASVAAAKAKRGTPAAMSKAVPKKAPAKRTSSKKAADSDSPEPAETAEAAQPPKAARKRARARKSA